MDTRGCGGPGFPQSFVIALAVAQIVDIIVDFSNDRLTHTVYLDTLLFFFDMIKVYEDLADEIGPPIIRMFEEPKVFFPRLNLLSLRSHHFLEKVLARSVSME